MVDQPQDWPWSSYLYTLGQVEAPAWLATDPTLQLFSYNRQQACQNFMKFVLAGQGVEVWKDLKHQIYLGGENFVHEQQQRIQDQHMDLSEVPLQQVRPVCKTLNFYRDKHPDRKHAMAAAYYSGGYTTFACLLELNRYIVLNPVRAKVVDQPQDWPWSSYFYTLGQVEAPAWLATDPTLQLFSYNRQQACQNFMKFVLAGQGVEVWKDLKHQIYLGGENFVHEQQQRIQDQHMDLSEVPLKQVRPVCKTLNFYREQTRNGRSLLLRRLYNG